MAKELAPIDISKLPELLRLAEEVRAANTPRVLRCNDEDVAILMPLASEEPQPARRVRPRADRDAILNLIGIGESAERTDVANNKHEYLAEAYEPQSS